MGTRIQLVVLGLLVAIVVGVLALAGWRSATDEQTTDRVTLSLDGARWTSDLEDAFFFSESVWSPGQTRSAIFWVRNDADVPAYVDVRVTSPGGGDPTHSGVLEVSAVLGDGDDDAPETTLDDGTDTVRVGTLQPGERETVTLSAEHAGDEDVDSAVVRHRISGSGTSAEEPGSALDVSDARLELAPFFLCIALLVTLVVMRRNRPPPPQAR